MQTAVSVLLLTHWLQTAPYVQRQIDATVGSRKAYSVSVALAPYKSHNESWTRRINEPNGTDSTRPHTHDLTRTAASPLHSITKSNTRTTHTHSQHKTNNRPSWCSTRSGRASPSSHSPPFVSSTLTSRCVARAIGRCHLIHDYLKTRPTDQSIDRSTTNPSAIEYRFKNTTRIRHLSSTHTHPGHRPWNLRLDPLQAHARHRHHHRSPADHHHDRRRHPITSTTCSAARSNSNSKSSSSSSHYQQQQWRGADEGARACGCQHPASGTGGGGVDRDGGGRGRGGIDSQLGRARGVGGCMCFNREGVR